MKLRIYILSIIVFTLCQFTFSQNPIEFNQLTGENVSTQSITYAIEQDEAGNLWIASEEGVLKHNSKFYQIYNTYNGLPEALNNRISEIFIDSKQQVWIGLEKGVCKYNKNLDIFEIHPSNEDINPSLITSITEDDNNNIWIGGFNGLWKINAKDKSEKLVRVVTNQNIQAVYPYKNKVLFGTSKGLFVYDTETGVSNEIYLNSKQNSISFIGIINNYFMVGTKTGELYKVDNNFALGVAMNLGLNITNPITDIIKKDANTIYLATDGNGLFRLNNSFSKLNQYKEDANNEYSLSSNGIYDIVLGKENILWIATYGGGINYLDSNRISLSKNTA